MKQYRKQAEKKITDAYDCRAAPRRVWIYCRVAGNNSNINVLEIQREQLEKYAVQNGWHVEGVPSDQQTGIDLMRPGITEVTEAVKNGRADIVLVSRMDRLARQMEDLLSYSAFLRQHNIKLHSMTEESVSISAQLQMAVTLREAFLKSSTSVM